MKQVQAERLYRQRVRRRRRQMHAVRKHHLHLDTSTREPINVRIWSMAEGMMEAISEY